MALKRLQEEHADHRKSQDRFVLEAEVTGRLEHRGIVPVYSFGHAENGRPFYAMRFVSGTSLKRPSPGSTQPRRAAPPPAIARSTCAGCWAGSSMSVTRWLTRTVAESSIAT